MPQPAHSAVYAEDSSWLAALRRHAALTNTSTQLRALLAITFLYPIILSATFFPTPATDLREYINLGLTLPLYTPRNPPLPSWVAGAIAWSGARDAWLFVLVAQVLNFAGLAYLVRTAKAFIGPHAALSVVIMFCGSLYYSAATPSMALNADQIAVPIWAGCLYHVLVAARDDRWRDWLAAGVFVSLGFLAKYYSIVILVVYLAAAAWVPTYRRIFTNGRFYAAGLIAAAITAVSVIPELRYANALAYGVNQFGLDAPLAERVWTVWQLLRSFVVYGLPAMVGLGFLARRGEIGRRREPANPAQEYMLTAAIGMVMAMLLMIAVGGLHYSTRYAYPFFGLSLLALLSVVRIGPRGLRAYANITLAIWAGIVVGTLIYTQVTIHRVFRDPAPAAARLVRDAWDGQYSCGPAYVLGDTRTARGIAIYFGRPVFGVAFEDVDLPNWLDRDRLERLGGVVIAAPDQLGPSEHARFLNGKSPTTIAVPYRRTWKTATHAYQYYFIAPGACPAR